MEEKLSGDEAYIESLSRMTEVQLLDEILQNPYVLTDVYYRHFYFAIHKRYDELVKQRTQN